MIGGRKATWWLSDGRGNAFGPYFKEEIATRWRRYRHYRLHSSATRRACWRKAGESPFAGRRRGSAAVILFTIRWLYQSVRGWWFCDRHGLEHEWVVVDDEGRARCDGCGMPGQVA